MIDDEKKYDELINTLKNLQQVKAAPNFEADLKRKLNEERYEKKEKKSFKSFLIPSRLIPSFGLVVIAVIIILSIDINSDETDNPFLIEPRVREDIVLISDADELYSIEDNKSNEKAEVEERKVERDKKDSKVKEEGVIKEEAPDQNLIAGRELSESESTFTDEADTEITTETSVPRATGFSIKKSALNFRQINPTVQEQQEIQQLKEEVEKQSKEHDLK